MRYYLGEAVIICHLKCSQCAQRSPQIKGLEEIPVVMTYTTLCCNGGGLTHFGGEMEENFLCRMCFYETPYVYLYLYIWLRVNMQIRLTIICKSLHEWWYQVGEVHICVFHFTSFASIFRFRPHVTFLYLQTLLSLTPHLCLEAPEESWGWGWGYSLTTLFLVCLYLSHASDPIFISRRAPCCLRLSLCFMVSFN